MLEEKIEEEEEINTDIENIHQEIQDDLDNIQSNIDELDDLSC